MEKMSPEKVKEMLQKKGVTKEDGRKHIVIDEKKSELVRWIFQKLASGLLNVEQVYLLARKKGAKSHSMI